MLRCTAVSSTTPLISHRCCMLPAGNTIGWQQQYCREVNQQYTCTAYCATGYRQGADGLPSSSCDVMTGQWTGVGGSCVPDNGGSGCSALPPFPAPKNTLGWRTKACYTTGFGLKATTICYATCINGCSGSGASGYDPYTVCQWATGVCVGKRNFPGCCDPSLPYFLCWPDPLLPYSTAYRPLLTRNTNQYARVLHLYMMLCRRVVRCEWLLHS
jgi:hypothetical protein